MPYVIVGLHAAGRSAAKTLRALAPRARIIGVDPDAAEVYARPLISYGLSGELKPEDMATAGDGYWEGLGVELIPERAVSLDPGARALSLESGRVLRYSKLLLACGASPRPAGVSGQGSGEVCYFRNRKDLHRILARARPGGTAAVLGGGLVGFKLTMGLLSRGMKVVLMVTSPRPLSLNVDEHVGDWAARRLAETPGVTLMTGTTVDTLTRKGDRLTLTTLAGESMDVDLVAAGKGVAPDIEWLRRAGLDTDQGLLVNDRLMTSAPDVHAAGDCVQARDLVLGRPMLNAIWPMAVEQGRAAAMNMAGYQSPYPGSLAMNAIPVFGSQMISVGAVNPRYTEGCDFLVSRTVHGSYLKLVFRDGALIGAVGLDAAPRLGEIGWAIRKGLGKDHIPALWLDRQWNAAPLSAATGSLAGNARL